MTIGIVLPNAANGGVQRVLINLAQGLELQGIDVVVFTLRGGRLPGIWPSGLTFCSLEGVAPLSIPARLASLCKEYGVDTIVSGITRANIASVMARLCSSRPLKVIVTKHLPLGRLSQNPIRRALLRGVVRYVYAGADAVVAVSTGTLASLSGVLPRSTRLAHIPNPVIGPKFSSLCEEHVSHPWIESGEEIVLGAGRLVQQKDFSALIRAFSMVRKERNAVLLILGEGDQRPQLEELIRRLDLEEYVSLPGEVSSAVPYMSKASVFVLSSQWEGLPTVLIEALAARAKVVAVDCPVGPAEILDGGKLGWLVRMDDDGALASAIVEALESRDSPAPHELDKYKMATVVRSYLDLMAQI